MGDAPATALSLVALALVLAREAISFAKGRSEEKPRETSLPPPPVPPPSQLSLQDARIDALSARVGRNEQLLDAIAKETREALADVGREVTEISTLIRERTNRGGRHGGNRESS